MPDHVDALGLQSPNMDASVDICDSYAFQKPGDPQRTVLVLDVNRGAPLYADAFAANAVYELKVDTNADAVAEIAYRFSFSPKIAGAQAATVRRVDGERAGGNGNDGDVIFTDIPVCGEVITIAEAGDYRFFAGIRSDPFFFDLEGMRDSMRFTGRDTFADKNVFCLVLELPNDALGRNPQVGIWWRVLIPAETTPFFQIGRVGRPLVNVAFIRDEDRHTFNRIEPTRDRKLFTRKLAAVLESHGHSRENARLTALALLPDILAYDNSSPAQYPNGRRLVDDVVDIQLAILTNGRVTTDHVGPHEDLLPTFPYLGPPHPGAEP